MNLRFPLFFVVIASVCFESLVSIALAADAPDAKASRPQLVKLISTSADGFGGFGGFGGGRGDRNPWVVVTPLEGGKPLRLPVPEAYAKRLEPFANSPGQLVHITVTAVAKNGTTTETVTDIAKYEGDAAITLPGVYQFDTLTPGGTDGKPPATVKLSKAGTARTVPIANRPAAAGSPAQPEPQVMARLGRLKQGDLVEVEFTGGKSPMVVDAYPYVEPINGEFLKLVTLKQAANKTSSAIIVLVGAEQKTYALPSATTGASAGVSPQANAAIAATQSLAKRLKPGNGVSFSLRDVVDTSAGSISPTTASPGPDGTAAPDASIAGTIRELGYAGRVELTGEKSLDVHSTYVRIEIGEGRGGGFGRGFGGGGGGGGSGNIEVEYHPHDNNADRAAMFRGIDRILESVDEAVKLNIVFEQADALNNALKPTRRRRATSAEQTAWVTAHKSWMNAASDDSRRKVEQDMIVAAQELSLRIRQDFQSAETAARSILKAGQAEGLQKLGAEERGGFPGRGPDRGRDRRMPGQNNPPGAPASQPGQN